MKLLHDAPGLHLDQVFREGHVVAKKRRGMGLFWKRTRSAVFSLEVDREDVV
jgi:hypothetical protein